MALLRISTDAPSVLAEDEGVWFCFCRSTGVEEGTQHRPPLSVKSGDGLVAAVVVEKSCDRVVSCEVGLVNVGIWTQAPQCQVGMNRK